MTEAYRQGFVSKCAEHGVPARMANVMLKSASKTEQNLVRHFLSKGKQVPIELASKVTGVNYPKQYRTLNDFLASRNDFFRDRVVPLMKEHRHIVSTAVPISDVIPKGNPAFRGVTRFHGKPGYVNGVTVRAGVPLPDYSYHGRWDRLLDKLSARRFFSGDLDTAKIYAEKHNNGTRWLRIDDLSTPVGKWALKNKVVVQTPRIDIPYHTYRKELRKLIDQGKIVPERDLIPLQSGFTLADSNFRLDSEMGIPAWIRPFLKEKSYKLVRNERGGRRDFVLPRAQGKRLDKIEKALDKLTYEKGPYQYKFDSFLGYES